MPNCFISYAKSDRHIANQLVIDVQKLGLNVWFDAGAHDDSSCWNTVLDNIRRCNVFVAVVSKRSTDSAACLAELEYARSLKKAILPLRIERSSLPHSINSQFPPVDYDAKERDSALVLGRSLIDVVGRSLAADTNGLTVTDSAQTQSLSQIRYLMKDVVRVSSDSAVDSKKGRKRLFGRDPIDKGIGDFGERRRKHRKLLQKTRKQARAKRRPLQRWLQISGASMFISVIATIKMSEREPPLASTIELATMWMAIALVAIAVCFSLISIYNVRFATTGQRLLAAGAVVSSFYASAYVLFTGHALSAIPFANI